MRYGIFNLVLKTCYKHIEWTKLKWNINSKFRDLAHSVMATKLHNVAQLSISK